ncbi:unnamed protein product [Aphanomyces euteiches]|uniref:RING-type domain-containing protein n=1 Tax=Aphanomyces euteiches TaxID=100861 RepID=A0A6G0W8G7_9STRA|nr:hypothetical protein Ae201684_017659 [Aphanomyces euteiches]KAH9100839.1 hypothetical protein Ae201684P_007031 [Aphanomyces euteiches]KAH9143103.1 hypothetical protein AeRB84_012878 [Aphanomyces euteiches]
MKFGKRMRSMASPEWEGGYVDYKGLKRRIKAMEGSDAARSAEFHQALLRELSKVNASFFWILDDLTKTQELDAQISTNDLDGLRLRLLSVLDLSHRIDSLRRFVVLNYLAVVKISKKFDKTLGGNGGSIDMIHDLLLQPFYAGSYVDQLYSQTASVVDSIMQSLVPDIQAQDASCPICLYPFTSPVTLSCMHTFCWSCLAKAAEHHIHACPLCRQVQSIDPRDYEIDGLIKRFVKTYGSVANDESCPAIVHDALLTATKHMEAIQRQYASMPPPPIVEPKLESKMLLPRVAAIAYVTSADSIDQAIRDGAHMVAMDVHVCASGQVVVTSDAIVQGSDPSQSYFIADLTASELAKRKILTLTDAMEVVKRRVAVYMNISTDRVIAPLMDTIAAACAFEEEPWTAAMFYIASGNHYQLLAVNGYRTSNAALQGMHTVVTTASIPLGYCQNFEQLHVSHVCVDSVVVTKPFVQDAHSRGIDVFVGIINHENMVWKVLEASGGVDGILSNFPSMLSTTLVHHALAQERHDNARIDDESLLDENDHGDAKPHFFRPGDPVEILHESKWYAGVVLGVHDSNKTPKSKSYSILWWMSDNSQRRATKVLPDQLRPPVPPDRSSYFGHGIDVAFGALRAAIEWATFPFTTTTTP